MLNRVGSLVLAVCLACGGAEAPAQPKHPQIFDFSASPASLPYGGGTVNLSWSATNDVSLSIDQNVGDVTEHAALCAHVRSVGASARAVVLVVNVT